MQLLRHRGILFSLFLLFYILFIQPIILQRWLLVEEGNNTDIILGFAILLAQAAEVFGVWLKTPSLLFRLRHFSRKNELGTFLIAIIAMCHLMLTAFMTNYGLKALGLDINTAHFLPGMLYLLIFIFLLIKDALLLGAWFVILGMVPPPKQGNLQVPRQIGITIALKEYFGDFLLLCFAAIAYTSTWEFIVLQAPLRDQGGFSLVWEYFGAVIMFSMLYPSIRGIYYLEEMHTQHSRLFRYLNLIIFFLIMFVAVTSIPLIK